MSRAMRTLHPLSLLLVASLCVGLALAASLNEQLPEARRLLKLVELINKGARPTVDDVVEAYKEYVRLYEIQTDLAAGFDSSKGKLGVEDKYDKINRLLSQEGVEMISENLFAAFDSNDPEQRLVITKRLRKNIEDAIDDLAGGR